MFTAMVESGDLVPAADYEGKNPKARGYRLADTLQTPGYPPAGSGDTSKDVGEDGGGDTPRPSDPLGNGGYPEVPAEDQDAPRRGIPAGYPPKSKDETPLPPGRSEGRRMTSKSPDIDDLLKQLVRDVGSLTLAPGQVTVLQVAHDRDCALLRGDDHCTCRPDVEVRRP